MTKHKATRPGVEELERKIKVNLSFCCEKTPDLAVYYSRYDKLNVFNVLYFMCNFLTSRISSLRNRNEVMADHHLKS